LKDAEETERAVQKKIKKDINNIQHIISEIEMEEQRKEQLKTTTTRKKKSQGKVMAEPTQRYTAKRGTSTAFS